MGDKKQKAARQRQIFHEMHHFILVGEIRMEDQCRQKAEPRQQQRRITRLPTNDNSQPAIAEQLTSHDMFNLLMVHQPSM